MHNRQPKSWSVRGANRAIAQAQIRSDALFTNQARRCKPLFSILDSLEHGLACSSGGAAAAIASFVQNKVRQTRSCRSTTHGILSSDASIGDVFPW
jgi:hypothetical protein